jgi:hypothetical protein
MDRRQFLTRSAALVAISTLPIPQAQAAIEPKMASGLIRHMHFRLTEPIRLVLDGPLTLADCYFENLIPDSSSSILFSMDDEPWREDVGFEIKPGKHPWAIFGCAVESPKGFKLGAALTIGHGLAKTCNVM